MGGGDTNLRHVVHKRVHLERKQPTARRRLGLLEKHKDYVKRAKDFHKKQDTIKTLHRKAYFKNKDEYHMSMGQHVQQKDGKVKKKNKVKDMDELRLLDSQDAQYVGMREAADKRAVEQARSRLHFLEAERPNKHTLFVDEDEMIEQAGGSASSSSGPKGTRPSAPRLQDYDVAKRFDTHPALLKRKANRPRLAQLETSEAFSRSRGEERQLQKSYRELFNLQERSKRLGLIREKLQLRNDLRGKGRRLQVKKEDGPNAAVWRWLPKRKR